MQASDPIRRLTTSQSPVFLVNSHNPHFSATSPRSWSKSIHADRHTFSRSYGVILPSSLTRVLSRALESSSRPPESVCGTDTKGALYAAFLGSVGLPSIRSKLRPHHLSITRTAVCPYRVLAIQSTGLNAHTNNALGYPTPSPLTSTPSLVVQEY